tara:strand:- start:333 stop:557 length:225 start_codon:yes stop_codon:yes gene_type:complete
MRDSKTITEAYEKVNSIYRMLIVLLDKWNDKNYSLTDEEWYTIKSYKTVLDVFFNEKAGIEKAIKANEEIIANL